MNQRQKDINGIKTILFDFGGTLDSDGINWQDRFYPLYKSKGFNWTKKQFAKYFYYADDFLSAQKRKPASYFQTIFLQVSLLLKRSKKYDPDHARQIAQLFIADSHQILKRNQKLLKKLKRKYYLGIVSNFYGNLPKLCKEMGWDKLIDVVIDSTIVGYSKPDPRIFYCALNPLNSSPRQSIFVGDSLSRDMEGSKMIGMPHIWLKDSNSNRKYACCSNDRVIRSLLDLEKIFL